MTARHDNGAFRCRDCGTEVSPNAAVCSFCGHRLRSNDNDNGNDGGGIGTGRRSALFSLHERHDSNESIPGEEDPVHDFDYQSYVEREFGSAGSQAPFTIDLRKVVWWCTAVILVFVFAYLATR